MAVAYSRFAKQRGPDVVSNTAGSLTKPKPSASSDAGTAPARARGLVSLWSPNIGVRVTARHAELPQVTQERAGGWEVRPRPGQVPRTWRPGHGQLLKVRLVLLLDGFTLPQRSVQPEINALRRLGYHDADKDEDARIIVVGAVPYAEGGIHRASQKTPPDWVIDDLSIVEEIHDRSTGRCLRAVATVDLLEYVEGDLTVRVEKARKATRKPWQKGDTLAKFAKRHGKQPEQIDKANPAIKKWSGVKPGALVRVPGIAG